MLCLKSSIEQSTFPSNIEKHLKVLNSTRLRLVALYYQTSLFNTPKQGLCQFIICQRRDWGKSKEIVCFVPIKDLNGEIMVEAFIAMKVSY